VAAFAGDFEEPDEDGFGAPLPPEDRLWRHPSELGSAAALGLDPIDVRRRWLSSPPSKASAWTAGVVGALLATGLVALGTHLATALTAHPGVTAGPAPVVASPGPVAGQLGSGLASSIHHTGASVASVEATAGGHERHLLGIVVRSDGMVLAPAAFVSGASTLQVTLPGTVPSVATLVALDRRSGLALLHVNGVSNLPVPHLGDSSALMSDSFALAITAPGGGQVAIGTLTSLDTQRTVGGLALTDVVTTDVPATEAPPGSALVDARGDLVGMVAGSVHGTAVAVPSWVVGPVVDQLLATGHVRHGWLGISGVSVAHSEFQPAGVRIVRVVPGSAAGIAGLRVGDIITSVNFQPIDSVTGLLGHLYGLTGGDEILVGVDRGTTDLFYRVLIQSRRPVSGVTG
jgi:S1-C subfamily serine protease